VRRLLTAMGVLALGAVIAPLASASGPLGIYGIIEKVVFEPNDRTPERVQVWGAFAYVELGKNPGASTVKRGYLYFRHPATGESIETVRREWADLAAVAGTGQAVGFGNWGYIGWFGALEPDVRPQGPPYILERRTSGTNADRTDLRVRAASEPPASPAAYQTNAGIVKLSATGSHAAIVQQMKAALIK
jgi:hypothetical protein